MQVQAQAQQEVVLRTVLATRFREITDKYKREVHDIKLGSKEDLHKVLNNTGLIKRMFTSDGSEGIKLFSAVVCDSEMLRFTVACVSELPALTQAVGQFIERIEWAPIDKELWARLRKLALKMKSDKKPGLLRMEELRSNKRPENWRPLLESYAGVHALILESLAGQHDSELSEVIGVSAQVILDNFVTTSFSVLMAIMIHVVFDGDAEEQVDIRRKSERVSESNSAIKEAGTDLVVTTVSKPSPKEEP